MITHHYDKCKCKIFQASINDECLFKDIKCTFSEEKAVGMEIIIEQEMFSKNIIGIKTLQNICLAKLKIEQTEKSPLPKQQQNTIYVDFKSFFFPLRK